MKRFIKSFGRCALAAPALFALFSVISVAWIVAVGHGGFWGVLCGAGLFILGPQVARAIVWLDRWIDGPVLSEPPRKPEQLSLWEAKP